MLLILREIIVPKINKQVLPQAILYFFNITNYRFSLIYQRKYSLFVSIQSFCIRLLKKTININKYLKI